MRALEGGYNYAGGLNVVANRHTVCTYTAITNPLVITADNRQFYFQFFPQNLRYKKPTPKSQQPPHTANISFFYSQSFLQLKPWALRRCKNQYLICFSTAPWSTWLMKPAASVDVTLHQQSRACGSAQQTRRRVMRRAAPVCFCYNTNAGTQRWEVNTFRIKWCVSEDRQTCK